MRLQSQLILFVLERSLQRGAGSLHDASEGAEAARTSWCSASCTVNRARANSRYIFPVSFLITFTSARGGKNPQRDS